MRIGRRRRQAGFAYYGLLFSVTAAALAAASGSHLLGNAMRREKEAELLACGDAIRRGIESYHAKNAAGTDPWPARLDWLIRDPHQPTVQRYLRRVCVDPMQEHGPEGYAKLGGWEMILDVNGKIVGVHSGSQRVPLKRGGFMTPYETFATAKQYADWRFVAAGGIPAPPNARLGGNSNNFIPSGGLLSPFLSAPTPNSPAANPVPAAAAPNGSATEGGVPEAAALPATTAPPPPRVPAGGAAAAPGNPATPAAPAAPATPATPAAPATPATPVEAPNAPPAAPTAPTAAPPAAPAAPPAPEAPAGGFQPFVIRPLGGW